MDVFVRVFSATTLLRIMKLFVYFQVGEVYCVNENSGANPHFAFFFSNFQFFLLSLLYNTYGHFSSKFSQKIFDLGL